MPQTDHARLSASSAERFMACPASVQLSELVPPEEESEFAAEGTAAHFVGEECLRANEDAWTMIGQEHYGFEVTAEMAEAVQEYIDYVRECAGDAELLVEHVLDNTGLGPDFGGTADAVINGIVDGGGFLHVLDYKHGVGIPVDIATEDEKGKRKLNTQLLYYAFGVLRSLGVQQGDNVNVGLSIVQPRANHHEGSIRTAWTGSDEVLEWAENSLLPALGEVQKESLVCNTGSHCRVCPAKLICPEMQESFTDFIKEADEKKIAGMDDEVLATWYDQIATVQMYITALKRECEKRALAGSPVAGTKLVYGRSSRKWKDDIEDEVIAVFGDDAFTDPLLKSPAQIEKMPGGKDIVGRLAYKEKGKPKLVSSTEKGETYKVEDAGTGFASVPEK